MTDQEKEDGKYNNSLVIDKRPYFFRYLYSDYNRKYVDYNKGYENYCITTFGKSLDTVLNYAENEKESDIQIKYRHFSPLLDSDCEMNNICHHMEYKVKEIKHSISKSVDQKLVQILKDEDFPLDKNRQEKFKNLCDIFKEYKAGRRSFMDISRNGGEMYKTMEQYDKYILQKSYTVSSNIQELATLAVIICYELYPSDSKYFVWNVFGEGVIENIKKHRQSNSFIPALDVKGDIEYLGKYYSMREISIVDESDFLDVYNF